MLPEIKKYSVFIFSSILFLEVPLFRLKLCHNTTIFHIVIITKYTNKNSFIFMYNCNNRNFIQYSTAVSVLFSQDCVSFTVSVTFPHFSLTRIQMNTRFQYLYPHTALSLFILTTEEHNSLTRAKFYIQAAECICSLS
jgi:hypothetical protein